MNSVRTRFAPSPTGYLHVGGVRTALFAWLVARQAEGHFILRLEDTDKAREVEGSGTHIMESLQWLGLLWDEGPDSTGPYGPYVQSQRLTTYKEWAQKLIDSGRAYADPFTPEQLTAFRQQAINAKQPFLFRNHRPESPPNWDGSQPLRFKSEPRSYTWHDEVLGDLATGPEVIDDFILIKSDGYPTYNFAHIIDDHLMQITHVIRAQEFIASMPNYLNLYDALKITPPIFAMLPPIMAADGKRKLGKRDGAKDILDYAREGYLPTAMFNFLASLGWNDGSEQEIFSKKELINRFKLADVQKSGAKFDEQRLRWINGHYIRHTPLIELYSMVGNFWPVESEKYDDVYKQSVLGLVQERLKFFAELPDLTAFFFVDLPVNLELIASHKQLKNLAPSDLKQLLDQTTAQLAASDFTVDDITTRLNQLLDETAQKPAVLFSLIRIATTQAPASPRLADTLVVLGKDTVLRRIKATLQKI